MKRAIVLLVLISAILSSSALLPPFQQIDSAISLKIAPELGEWRCHVIPETKEERSTLAPDTLFSKAICLREAPGDSFFRTDVAPQRAEVSIVLSGHDLANSIHRPERCMPAQGHEIHGSTSESIEIPGHTGIPVRRLLSTRPHTEAGQIDYVTYYFFVGHDHLTENHMRRTLMDISDRLFKGQAQRWAYVSVTTAYRTEKSNIQGLPDLAGADEAVKSLIAQLSRANLDWSRFGS